MRYAQQARFHTAWPCIALIGALGMMLLLSGCASGTSGGNNNPVPSISSLSPSSAAKGGSGFTLTVSGANFLASSTVQWNGSNRPTTLVSGTQLTASILAGDIAIAGTAQVTVVNPAPGGGTSNAATFTITTQNPFPTITSLSPSSGTAGGAAFTLTVNGTNFVASSTVQWNGSNRATTLVSGTQLTASILAGDIATAGTTQVTVVNPAPGGGTSNAAAFTINNPVPTITSLSPSSTTAGGAPFTLTVNGTNFVASSTVQWNGTNRTTTFVSGTQVTASIPAADIATAGTAQVTVVNPAPGGGTSSAATFTIAAGQNPVPAITSLSPSSVTAELTGFALTVNGTGFVGGSVGQWNGANRATIVMSSTQLLLAPLPADNAAAGNALVTVVNPTPGGGTSNSVSISVGALPPNSVGVTDRLSVAADSAEANGDSVLPAISSDRRFIAFQSSASNLVPGDSNGSFDIFVRDTCAGATGCTPSTNRISVASDGSQANDSSFSPAISADGRFIAFVSSATNLVSVDTNGVADVFLRDTCVGGSGCTPSTIRISVASDGSQGNGGSFDNSMSANGRFVVFQSSATNLVAGDTNGVGDIFVRDTCIGASGCTPSTFRVSVDSAGVQGNNASFLPKLTGNGRFVVFTSFASNLVASDTNLGHDVFVRDTCFGASGSCTPSTVRVSVDSSGNQADAPSGGPATNGASISADGRFIAFGSRATNLVSGDTNGTFDIFVRDTCVGASGCTPATLRVSVALDGTQSFDRSDAPAITADGRFVVFYSVSTNFLPGDTNLSLDIFLARTGKP